MTVKRITPISDQIVSTRYTVPQEFYVPNQGHSSYQEIHEFADQINDQLLLVDDLKQLTEKILLLVNDLGFTDFGYSILYKNNELGPQLYSVDGKMVDEYQSGEYHTNNLITQHASKKGVGPFFQSTIENHILNSPYSVPLFERNLVLMQLSRSFGFDDYYFIPMHSMCGDWNILLTLALKDCKTADFCQIIEAQGSLLNILCHAIDWIIFTRLYKEFLVPHAKRPLSQEAIDYANLLINYDFTQKQANYYIGVDKSKGSRLINEIKAVVGAKTHWSALIKVVMDGHIPYKPETKRKNQGVAYDNNNKPVS